jgi:alpha-beta hydrolase superfamily lysophospholipase
MQSEIIRLANGDLIGEWHHAKAKRQLIVVCHGYQGSGDSLAIVALASGLNKDNRDTFTFNFSKNMGGFDIEHQVKDVAKIIEHFESYEEIVLLGISFAALTASVAAIQMSKVDRLITINGFFGSGRLGKEHRGTFRKFRLASMVTPRYRKIWKYYKEKLQPAKLAIPVLVIHSKVDVVVPIEQSRHFFEQVSSPKEFKTLQTATHGLSSGNDVATVVETITTWLKKPKP